MKLKMALLMGCFVVAALFARQAKNGLAPAASVRRPARELTGAGGATPLYFVANKGQYEGRALFQARTPGYTLWLTREGLAFDRIEKDGQGKANRTLSRLTFVGADPDVEVVASDPSDYEVSYFYGRDESDWKTGIPTSKAVLYENLYEGIDLKVYGTERQIEYDWIVAPGADPAKIRFDYSGAEKPALDEDGSLVIETPAGRVVQRKPVSHQIIDGREIAVESAFRSLEDGSFGFALGAYDPSRALVIDPLVHAYSTYLGGHKSDGYTNIAVDGKGAMYISGLTMSGDFPPEMGSLPRVDDFVTKLSPDGSSLVYTAFFPTDWGYGSFQGMCVDAMGFVYLCGTTTSSHFPLKNPFQPVFEGHYDGYILKLAKDGRSLVYSSYIGGDDLDFCTTVDVDASGAVYIGGSTESKNFPTKRAFRSKLSGYRDAFAAKISPQGSTLVYSTYLGGTHGEWVKGIDVDSAGGAVLAGSTTSPDFPRKGAFQRTLGGKNDGFIAKLTPSGNGLVYSSYFGGPGDEELVSVALDGTGAAYVVGYTFGKIPHKNAFQSTKKGESEGLVAKIAPNGRSLVFASYLGGVGFDYAEAIAVDESGAAYIAGRTTSRDFPIKAPYQAFLRGSQDGYLTIIHPSGDKLLYSTFLGGVYKDSAYGIALDGVGAIYLSGMTNSPNLPLPASGAYQDKLAGDNDAFVFKFTQGNNGSRR